MRRIVPVLLALLVAPPSPSMGRDLITVGNRVTVLQRLVGVRAEVHGRSELHLTASASVIIDSVVNLRSNDAWLFFDAVRPSAVAANHLGLITVNGELAVLGQNVRVTQYANGSVVIPHPSDYRPLEVFAGPDLTGASLKIGTHEYYRFPGLLDKMKGTMGSFSLKRGYMATFAQEPNGRGFSKLYVAQDGDVSACPLPEGFAGRVAFIRVIPWRWTTKKGWCGGWVPEMTCAWRYDWDNAATSTLDTEYVPMRHNRNWNAYENINDKKDSTHVLGFNEPDRSDQAKMTVEEALAQWPRLLESGLRLGSPAPSDGGQKWLYDFIDAADALGYRIDFVAIHFYKGGWTADQYYRWLKGIHERTRRPIWITEFNNGANWTPPEPTLEENAVRLREFLEMLDKAEFVERYSIYNWVGKGREMIFNWKPVAFTPAGTFYRDHGSVMAYRTPGPVPHAPDGVEAKAVSSMRIDLSWNDLSTDEAGFIVERRTGAGVFKLIATVETNTTVFSDAALASSTEYRYRIVACNLAGRSEPSREAGAATPAGIGIIPRSDWKVLHVDSEEKEAENNNAGRAFDGKETTWWHTQWSGSPTAHPHEIQLDLGKVWLVSQVRCLPRQDGNPNGTIAGYRLYTSLNGKSWGVPVSAGTWGKSLTEKEAVFTPVNTRYVRLVADSEVGGGSWTSVAEINVLGETPAAR